MTLEQNIGKASNAELNTLIGQLENLELWQQNNVDIVMSITEMLLMEIISRGI